MYRYICIIHYQLSSAWWLLTCFDSTWGTWDFRRNPQKRPPRHEWCGWSQDQAAAGCGWDAGHVKGRGRGGCDRSQATPSCLPAKITNDVIRTNSTKCFRSYTNHPKVKLLWLWKIFVIQIFRHFLITMVWNAAASCKNVTLPFFPFFSLSCHFLLSISLKQRKGQRFPLLYIKHTFRHYQVFW